MNGYLWRRHQFVELRGYTDEVPKLEEIKVGIRQTWTSFWRYTKCSVHAVLTCNIQEGNSTHGLRIDVFYWSGEGLGAYDV